MAGEGVMVPDRRQEARPRVECWEGRPWTLLRGRREGQVVPGPGTFCSLPAGTPCPRPREGEPHRTCRCCCRRGQPLAEATAGDRPRPARASGSDGAAEKLRERGQPGSGLPLPQARPCCPSAAPGSGGPSCWGAGMKGCVGGCGRPTFTEASQVAPRALCAARVSTRGSWGEEGETLESRGGAHGQE